MFKINIHNLKEGEQRYEFTAKQEDLDLGDVEFTIPESLKVIVELYKIDSQISLKVFLKGKIEYNCDRCLEKYTDKIDTENDLIYKFEFRELQNDADQDEEIKFISPSTVYVDLKEDLRDFILLSIPLRKAPEETDGICSFCNKNINEILNIREQEDINPVWEKLIKSKTK
ncbi:MAG: DUF177 domain-containing protein [Ignavibacteriae bacterium]|nr:DUF177 domain-containing protein [Ignavibacteriota bacterium]